jgi:hypothetical protein
MMEQSTRRAITIVVVRRYLRETTGKAIAEMFGRVIAKMLPNQDGGGIQGPSMTDPGALQAILASHNAERRYDNRGPWTHGTTTTLHEIAVIFAENLHFGNEWLLTCYREDATHYGSLGLSREKILQVVWAWEMLLIEWYGWPLNRLGSNDIMSMVVDGVTLVDLEMNAHVRFDGDELVVVSPIPLDKAEA